MGMKSIEERAKEYVPYPLNPDYMIPAYITDKHITGEKEQRLINKEAILKSFTAEELRAELKRRNAEEKAKKASILRCRMCKHWGAINYWGEPTNYSVGDNRSCKFFKTKNGKYYRCHRASQLACDNFERKEE